MIPPLDPFALKFDSIEIDPERAPTPEAIESAFALCAREKDLLAASAAAPEIEPAGFYLLDDAQGRFEVDRDSGVISLKDAAPLERNAIHTVRLRVVEVSGTNYEIELRLRVTGRVPLVVGAEEFDFVLHLAAPAASNPAPPPRARVTWAEFTAALGAQIKPALADGGPFGALLRAPPPRSAAENIVLAFAEAAPAPAPVLAAWSL